MRITKQTAPHTALKELTARLARFRIENGFTQAQLANQAGVSKRTIERIESGCDLQITTLIRLLRVLGLLDRLDQLIPEQTVSLIDMLAGETKPPKRARYKKTAQAEKPWKWGDEQ